MNRAANLVAAALLALAACASHAQKATLDVGYSDCRAQASPPGQWWQPDQDHANGYKAGCGTFGASFELNSRWTAGIHYVNLGRFQTHALAQTVPGDDPSFRNAALDNQRAECQPAFNENNCLYLWNTASFVRGVNFSMAYRLFDIGDVQIQAKGGLYFHKLSNHGVVTPLGCRDGCTWQEHLDQSAERISPMWGVRASWKYFYASWEAYERIGEHTPVTANIKGRIEVKTIGVSIPL